MSPLVEAIYQVLAQRVGLQNPLLTYYDLVKRLPSLPPPDDNLSQNDDRLFRALGEVGRACHDRGLPTLTALVIRSIEQSPGSGYYSMFHPDAGKDPVRQRQAWEQELARVKATSYPPTLEQGPSAKPEEPTEDRQRPHQLGFLRIANDSDKPTTVFTGQVTCPRCANSLEVHVERHPMAVSPKQPPFLIVKAGASSTDKPIGHLFVGTILTSPTLYYGSLSHCGPEQWVCLFFNRALRDRLDPHLVIMPSTSGHRDTPPGDDVT